ncbi:MAG: hypothetical protein V3U73_03060, partial [bacterium]
TPDDAVNALEDFLGIFSVLYPSPSSFSIFRQLLRKYRPAGLKIHDYEITSIGLSNGVSEVATFNTKDFENIEEIQLVES